MSVFERIKTFFDEQNVSYEILTHAHVHTSVQAASVRGTKLSQAAKALILKTKQGMFFMLIVPGHKKADLKQVKALVKVKNCSLASPEDVLKVTGCKVGTVPPLGNLFSLLTYCEESLLDEAFVVFSAGSHYHSIKMQSQAFVRATKPKMAVFAKSL